MDTTNIFLCLVFIYISVQTLRSILRKQSTGKLPPGPTRFPIIGNLLHLGDKPHETLAKLAATHGPLMCLKLGQVTTIIVSSASVAKQLLHGHDLTVSSRTVPYTRSANDHDKYSIVWLPPNATWRNLRKICNSNLFATQKLDSNRHLRSQKVQDLVDMVRESSRRGAAVEIAQAAFTTSLNLMSNTIFSVDLADQNSDTAREFKKQVMGYMEIGGKHNIADRFHVLRRLDPQGARRRMGEHIGKVLTIIRCMIGQRLTQKSNLSNDMLDTLLRIHREEGLDMTLIEHLLLDLFLDGTETTSITVEWIIADLLRNPEKLRKVRAELEEKIGRGNLVKESDISNLPYLQAVVKETMRLHPAVPLLLPRKSDGEIQIGGFTIPKGAMVLVNWWAIGRDPTTWEDPNSYVPERFLGSEIDVKGRNFEMIPFGSGRRICPGMPLAIRMVPLMVASLIHGFEWKLEGEGNAEEMDMEDKVGLTLVKAQPLRAIPISLT